MGYFSEDTIKRVELEAEGYWVDVKTNLKYGDIKNFVNIAKDGVVDTVASMDAFLKSAIVDWNLDDSEGKKVPITADSINKLEQKDAIAIINTAGAAVAGDKQADADFLDKSEPSSEPA